MPWTIHKLADVALSAYYRTYGSRSTRHAAATSTYAIVEVHPDDTLTITGYRKAPTRNLPRAATVPAKESSPYGSDHMETPVAWTFAAAV